jgi:hypothetical protein
MHKDIVERSRELVHTGCGISYADIWKELGPKKLGNWSANSFGKYFDMDLQQRVRYVRRS